MDIWGVDISNMCKTNRPHDEKTDPTETENLYDIPPQYRQGATPIKGSQEKYGQPKYTQKEWRKTMHQVIRANYGIHDEQQTTTKSNHSHDEQQTTTNSNHSHDEQQQPRPTTHNRPHQTKTTHIRLPLRDPRPTATQPESLDVPNATNQPEKPANTHHSPPPHRD